MGCLKKYQKNTKKSFVTSLEGRRFVAGSAKFGNFSYESIGKMKGDDKCSQVESAQHIDSKNCF